MEDRKLLSILEFICHRNVNVNSRTQVMTPASVKEETSSMAGTILNVQEVRFLVRETVV
jgi:hypothetical protein